MLEIRPNCENCAKPLPNNCFDAMICSFECTFCMNCVTNILFNVCPNCGGGFEKRPVRPQALFEKYPASTVKIIKQINQGEFVIKLNKYQSIKPNHR